MKTTLKLVAVAVVLFGMNSAANAFVMDILLKVDAGTWTLNAKTDAPGGIASLVVDLQGVASGVSDAPRGDAGGGIYVKGFTQGNIFAASQAFAGQNTAAAASTVKQVGFADVPDASFTNGIFTMVGSGIRDAQGYVQFYHGTNTGDLTAAFKLPQPVAFGAVWETVNSTAVIGAGAQLTATYRTETVPEPGTMVLLGLAVPALAYAIRRRKAA